MPKNISRIRGPMLRNVVSLALLHHHEMLVTHRCAILGAKKERRKFQSLTKFLLASERQWEEVK
jgi:hypothetical protein